jgi:hypothetical protein
LYIFPTRQQFQRNHSFRLHPKHIGIKPTNKNTKTDRKEFITYIGTTKALGRFHNLFELFLCELSVAAAQHVHNQMLRRKRKKKKKAVSTRANRQFMISMCNFSTAHVSRKHLPYDQPHRAAAHTAGAQVVYALHHPALVGDWSHRPTECDLRRTVQHRPTTAASVPKKVQTM